MKPYQTGNRTAGIIGLIVMTAAAFLLVCYAERLYEWLEQAVKKPVAYADGIYEGEGQGYGGIIRAAVTVEGGQITEVKLEGPEETPELGGRAIKKMPAVILEEQTPDVDGVSGATLTSGGIRDAVRDALEQAADNG